MFFATRSFLRAMKCEQSTAANRGGAGSGGMDAINGYRWPFSAAAAGQ